MQTFEAALSFPCLSPAPRNVLDENISNVCKERYTRLDHNASHDSVAAHESLFFSEHNDKDIENLDSQVESGVPQAMSLVLTDNCMQNNDKKSVSDDSSILRESSSHSKSGVSSNKRGDVMNKTVLRVVRRFYQTLFKAENPKIVKNRFKCASSKNVFAAVRRLLSLNVLPKLGCEKY